MGFYCSEDAGNLVGRLRAAEIDPVHDLLCGFEEARMVRTVQ